MGFLIFATLTPDYFTGNEFCFIWLFMGEFGIYLGVLVRLFEIWFGLVIFTSVI
jgi:hypothetical protein